MKGRTSGCTGCDSSGDCSMCSANYYLSNGQCSACMNGMTSPAGSASSSACSSANCGANFYRSNGECVACGNGKTSDPGSVSPSACSSDSCARNFYRSNGQCVACENGKTSFPGSVSSAACTAAQANDGGLCQTDKDCASGPCRGTRCCGTKGQSTGCIKCDTLGGCAECSGNYFNFNGQCNEKAAPVSTYNGACVTVSGGTCTSCSSARADGCTALSCNVNKFDANNKYGDGCEAGCAAVTGGTCTACWSAVAGGCTAVTCTAGSLNTDKNPANGCEASTPTGSAAVVIKHNVRLDNIPHATFNSDPKIIQAFTDTVAKMLSIRSDQITNVRACSLESTETSCPANGRRLMRERNLNGCTVGSNGCCQGTSLCPSECKAKSQSTVNGVASCTCSRCSSSSSSSPPSSSSSDACIVRYEINVESEEAATAAVNTIRSSNYQDTGSFTGEFKQAMNQNNVDFQVSNLISAAPSNDLKKDSSPPGNNTPDDPSQDTTTTSKDSTNAANTDSSGVIAFLAVLVSLLAMVAAAFGFLWYRSTQTNASNTIDIGQNERPSIELFANPRRGSKNMINPLQRSSAVVEMMVNPNAQTEEASWSPKGSTDGNATTFMSPAPPKPQPK